MKSATIKHDLNDALAFIRVVEAGSFTQAAKAMGLPTSTVSRRVARLEQQLGVRLLARTTRKQSLTDAGRIYYDRSSAAVTGLGNAEASIANLQGAPRGRIRLTGPAGLAGLSALVVGFLEAHPDVAIDLDLTNRRVDLIEEGYDLAIRGGALRDASLVAKDLAEIEFALVASPAYLKRRGTPKSVEDLRQHDCVIYGARADRATWSFEGSGDPIRVVVKGRIAANHWDSIRDAAISGLGIALLPVPHAREDVDAQRLRRILRSARAPRGAFWVAYPNRRHVTSAVRAFALHCAANVGILTGTPPPRPRKQN